MPCSHTWVVPVLVRSANYPTVNLNKDVRNFLSLYDTTISLKTIDSVKHSKKNLTNRWSFHKLRKPYAYSYHPRRTVVICATSNRMSWIRHTRWSSWVAGLYVGYVRHEEHVLIHNLTIISTHVTFAMLIRAPNTELDDSMLPSYNKLTMLNLFKMMSGIEWHLDVLAIDFEFDDNCWRMVLWPNASIKKAKWRNGICSKRGFRQLWQFAVLRLVTTSSLILSHSKFQSYVYRFSYPWMDPSGYGHAPFAELLLPTCHKIRLSADQEERIV